MGRILTDKTPCRKGNSPSLLGRSAVGAYQGLKNQRKTSADCTENSRKTANNGQQTDQQMHRCFLNKLAHLSAAARYGRASSGPAVGQQGATIQEQRTKKRRDRPLSVSMVARTSPLCRKKEKPPRFAGALCHMQAMFRLFSCWQSSLPERPSFCVWILLQGQAAGLRPNLKDFQRPPLCGLR